MPSQPKRRPEAAYSHYLVMSFKMGLVIAAGVFGGRYLDSLTGLSFPLMTILLSLLGVVMAIVVLVRDTSR